MEEDKWWEQKEYEIEDFENDESGVTNLCGREVDGEWEYAIVRWRYQVPYLVRRFKSGKVLDD